MALYTLEEITAEVEENKAHILSQRYPEDLAGEYADSAVPVYYADIIREWVDLPEEFSNRFSEIRSGELPERIEDLMRDDLYLYYWNHYSGAIAELVEQTPEEAN